MKTYLKKTAKGRHLMNGITFPIANHFKTHPEKIPIELVIEIIKACNEAKLNQAKVIKSVCNSPEDYICNVNNDGICELPTYCVYKSD